MNDTELFLKKLEKCEEERAEALKQAKVKAKETGKEPFDFEKLYDLYDVTSDFARGSPQPSREKKMRYEQKYYLDYPDVMSIEEFAERLHQLDVYNP